MSATKAHESLRKYGRTFHLASLFLNPLVADSAAKLYALCREVDDIADLATSKHDARERLDRLLVALHGRDKHCLFVNQFFSITPDIQSCYMVELFQGVQRDLGPVRITSQDELLHYAYEVAGTVGLMMCDVLRVSDPQGRRFAADLGIAMQLTNIARDVLEDADADRRYLPSDWVGSIDPQDILRADSTTKLSIDLGVQRLLVLAESFYASGSRGFQFLDLRSRIAIRIAARVYREIGLQIYASPESIWHGRTTVSTARKWALAGREVINTLLSIPSIGTIQYPAKSTSDQFESH